MADTTLTNIANINGTYNGIPITLDSEASVVQMIDGLTITKVADKQNWATGVLTFTVTITNNATSPLESGVFSDTLDPTLIKLVDNSVMLNNTATPSTYDATTGVLTFSIPTIEAGGKAEITFQVQKV